jgi:hypothetical protein
MVSARQVSDAVDAVLEPAKGAREVMIMPTRKTWNVEQRSNGRWVVQRQGSIRADSVHLTKDAAVSRAVALCRLNHGDLHVRNRDGDIYDARSYSQVYRHHRSTTRDVRRHRASVRSEPPESSIRGGR